MRGVPECCGARGVAPGNAGPRGRARDAGIRGVTECRRWRLDAGVRPGARTADYITILNQVFFFSKDLFKSSFSSNLESSHGRRLRVST